MPTDPTPESFRAAPLGWWSTAETVPYGEAIGFYPNGIGVHRWYSGLACEERYFEWRPAGDFRLHVFVPDEPEEIEEGDEPAGWDAVSYSVVVEQHYDRPCLQLRAMFGPLVGLDPLWYCGPAEHGPTSNWPRGRSTRRTGHDTAGADAGPTSDRFALRFGVLVGGMLVWYVLMACTRSPLTLLIGLITGLVVLAPFGSNKGKSPRA